MFLRFYGDLAGFWAVCLIFIGQGLRTLLFFEFLDFADVEPIECDLNWLFGEATPYIFLVFLLKQKNSYSVSSITCFDFDLLPYLFLFFPSLFWFFLSLVYFGYLVYLTYWISFISLSFGKFLWLIKCFSFTFLSL